MSNGLLDSANTAGYGWDTSKLIENTQNINTHNESNIDKLFENEQNTNSKLKPYKNHNAPQQQSQTTKESNPFSMDTLFDGINEANQNTNTNDSAYINPFADVQKQSQQHPSSTTTTTTTQKQSKEAKQTIDPDVSEVLDLLYFDNNDKSQKNGPNGEAKDNDSFYAFDFGQLDAPTNDKLRHQKSHQSSSSSDSYSSSADDYESSNDEKEKENKNKKMANALPNDLKLQPPKKQSSRSKKRRNSSKVSSKTKNERAFDKLHQKFDPSLFGQPNDEKKKVNEKKRNTEPANIHSERQRQLKEEGLIKNKQNDIQSPNVGNAQRANNKKKKQSDNAKPAKKSLYNVLPELHRGTALLKYGRRGYPHFRQFNLTADNEHIRWFSTKKKLQQSSINVGVINEILTGQHTKEFRRIAWTTLTPASFSIIYQNKKKSLNLVAKSVDEMKMWVDALRRLRDMKKKGENLSKLEKLEVEVDFRDRNRPQSRNHSGNFLRSHETKERQVDPILQKKLIDDIAVLRKTFIEISREANNPIVQSTKEYESIEQILSELEERVEELDHEVRNTRNTKIAENDVWRTRIDLESLRDKIKVINKQHKNEYKASKRRWSVF